MSKPIVLRGGSWFSYREFARAVYRSVWSPDLRNYAIGFRIARKAL